MKVFNFYYNTDTELLYIEFATNTDLDDSFRIIEISKNDIEYYSPVIINVDEDIYEEEIIEILDEYFKNNELPETSEL